MSRLILGVSLLLVAACAHERTVTQPNDLVKQGYRTGVRHGQVVYCRTEQLTGSRFKTEVCLSEAQVLDEQKRAKDTLTAPRTTRCLGPECN